MEPALALLRKKTKEDWSQEHRNVARKLLQQRLYDIGLSDGSKCQACHKEKGTEKHKLYHCPEWYEIRKEIPDVFRKLGAKSQNFKERMEVAKRYR